MKRGEWKRTKYVGVSLVGKTLAIMGFGKVLLLHLAPHLRSPAAVQTSHNTDMRMMWTYHATGARWSGSQLGTCCQKSAWQGQGRRY